MAQLLKGAPVAAAITENLITRAAALRKRGVEPRLAMLRIGERADDVAYEHAARRRCESVGIATERTVLPADCAEADVIRELERINADDTIHGCLMFRPLPKHLDERRICEALSPLKDVDGMTFASLTTVFTRSGEGFAPCTAQSVVELLDHYGVEIEGARTGGGNSRRRLRSRRVGDERLCKPKSDRHRRRHQRRARRRRLRRCALRRGGAARAGDLPGAERRRRRDDSSAVQARDRGRRKNACK